MAEGKIPMICVYDAGNTAFEGNGNAVLTPLDAKVKMVAGGNYDMQLTCPIDPEGKWAHLVPEAVIRVPVPEEEIENAFAGYDADVYKVTGGNGELRETALAPTTISYPNWPSSTAGTTQAVGAKSSYQGKNWECTYWDPTSRGAMTEPPYSSWYKEIQRTTPGAPVLVTLPAGTDLYFVEDYNDSWYKMSTYYGIVGYIEKSKVVYDRHLTPSETKPRIITTQLLRITNASVDTKSRTVSVTAQHVSYDLNGIIVKDVTLNQASPAMAIGRIVEGLMIDYPGTIATNLTSEDNGTYSETIKGKTGIYCLLDPDKGIVSKFDAAYKRDNWDLFVMERTETDRGFRLKYRKNMLGVNWTRTKPTATRIVPVAKDEGGADLYLPEQWVDSPLINNYPVIRMERLTVKGQIGKDKGTGDGSTWDASDLYDEMRAKAEERFTIDRADRVIHDVTVDFEMLGSTEEYAELKNLESVLLYDTVNVEDEEIGLSTQLTVTELEWDPIKEKVVALKLSNGNEKGGKNVTGYNVQAKSIGSDKLADEVTDTIIQAAVDIMPEYADPDAERPSSDISVIDSLTSTSTTDALSANQGRVLNGKKPGTTYNKSASVASKTFVGVTAFISGSAKNAYITIPLVLAEEVTAINVTLLKLGLRIGAGGYLGGADSYDATNLINTVNLYKDQGMLEIVCNKSDGWNVTNNSVASGRVTLGFSLS